jgi:hypothetical protein
MSNDLNQVVQEPEIQESSESESSYSISFSSDNLSAKESSEPIENICKPITFTVRANEDLS